MIDSDASPWEPPSNVRYKILGWLSTAAVLAYLCRNSVGVAESTIREDLNLSLEEMGWFLGSFFWVYALAQVPAGDVGRRFGTRNVLGWGAVLWSVAMVLMGAATGLWLLVIAQGLMGLAQAAVFPCAVQSVAHWIPKSHRASSCAFLSVGMQVGAILAATLTGKLISDWDWRSVFLVYSLPGILWAVGFSSRFTNRPESSPIVNSAELALIQASSDETPHVDDVRENVPWEGILKNPSVLCLCGQQIFRAAGYAFFASWFPTFLQETRGVTIADSGLLQASVFGSTLLGGLVGGLVIDAVYRKTGSLRLSRSGVGATCTFLCSLLIFSAYFAASPAMAILLIDAGAFAASIAGPCAYVTTIDLGGKHVPSVFGLMNMAGNLAAAATPILIGYFFSLTSNWNLILFSYGFAYLLASTCWAFTNPMQTVSSRISSPEII